MQNQDALRREIDETSNRFAQERSKALKYGMRSIGRKLQPTQNLIIILAIIAVTYAVFYIIDTITSQVELQRAERRA